MSTKLLTLKQLRRPVKVLPQKIRDLLEAVETEFPADGPISEEQIASPDLQETITDKSGEINKAAPLGADDASEALEQQVSSHGGIKLRPARIGPARLAAAEQISSEMPNNSNS